MSRTSCIAVVFCVLISSACANAPTVVPEPGRQPAVATGPQSQPPGQFVSLYRFLGRKDGARPQSALLFAHGLWYGTTPQGGDKRCQCGIIFSIDAAGHENVAYRFRGGDDGGAPVGGMIESGGVFYGTATLGGGTDSYCSGQGYDGGCGTVFAFDPSSGAERTVFAFQGRNGGSYPDGDLVAIGGKLYGTTNYGGAYGCDCGTIFAVDPAHESGKTIYRFTGGKDGSYPDSGLTAIDGTLYGTATGGGSCDNGKGCGSVFTVQPSGKLHVVHAFVGGDGADPRSNPIKVNGTIYGTTYDGGPGCVLDGCGTIYTIDASGSERLIWVFGIDRGDGMHPAGDLAVAHGKVYGVTQVGGNSKCFRNGGCGTLFAFDPSTGLEAAVHHFVSSDGAWPLGGLTARAGVLYGTTDEGGKNDWGTVFSFAPSPH